MTEARKTQVQSQCGRTAEEYVKSPGHAGGEDLERLLAWGRARGAARVLDIATGGGHTALGFAGFTRSVVATDVTEPMLRAARRFIHDRGAASVRFVAADVESLPFRDASFGVVTCRISAHHFPELLPAVRQVSRVLVPGGAFLIQDILGREDRDLAAFILEVEKRRDPSHVRAFTQREWAAFLKAAGLTVIDEMIMEKEREWEQWTERMRMTEEAKADLERFVLAAPPACREAFAFKIDGPRILSFTDRMLLLRADKD